MYTLGTKIGRVCDFLSISQSERDIMVVRLTSLCISRVLTLPKIIYIFSKTLEITNRHQYHLQQKYFQVIGRKIPTETDPDPEVYRMRVFAPNPVTAKSRFWYFLHKLHKLKKTTGEILSVNEIFERKTSYVKNYGVWLRYNSRSVRLTLHFSESCVSISLFFYSSTCL